MKKTIFSWIPLILIILAIGFMVLFSFDSFEGNEPVGRKLLGFLMHNIPALILIAITVIAWRWELIGGILLVASSLAGCWRYGSFQGNPGSLMVFGPVLVAGALFILSFARTCTSRTPPAGRSL